MVMKKRILSLRIIFFEYLFGMALMFVLSFSIPFALFNLGINTGLYTYANFSEIQAKNMEHKIAEANPFNSALVPASCTYVYVSPDYAVLQSNMMQEEMKNAVAYAQGKYSPPTNDDCFFVIKRDDGFCILHYYIRSRYTVDWMNRYLPSMDVLLIVTKLDRIARSTIHGAQLVEELIGRGVRLNILNMGIMDDTPSSKLIRNVFFAFAEFERDMIVERTSEGKQIARQKENFKEGRPPVEVSDFGKFLARQKSGEITVAQAIKELGISKATWYNLAKKYKKILAFYGMLVYNIIKSERGKRYVVVLFVHISGFRGVLDYFCS